MLFAFPAEPCINLQNKRLYIGDCFYDRNRFLQFDIFAMYIYTCTCIKD